MAMITDLKTDYKDDVLDTSANERRKFQMITNDDGTVSFVDVTDYLQTGDSFGASELNAMNERSNEQDALLAITDGERVITPQIAYDELSSCVNPENLIPYPYYETTHTDNGITWTDNGDGTVTANGTATGASVFYMVHNTSEPIQAEKCKYTLNGCPSGGSSSKYAVRLYESTKSLPILCTDIGAGAVFDNSNGNILGIATACVIYKGTTVENLTFKPMLVKGSHKCDYAPYSLSKAKLREDVDALNSSLTSKATYLSMSSGIKANDVRISHARITVTATASTVAIAYIDISKLKVNRANTIAVATMEHTRASNYMDLQATSITATISDDGTVLTVIVADKDGGFTVGQLIDVNVLLFYA